MSFGQIAVRQTYPTQLPSTIKLLQIPVDDTANANLLSHFAACCDFIAAARLHSEGVLVHCQAGVSRSSSIVIAYLIRELGMTVDQATAKVKKARTGVEPSETFKEQLGIWERCDGEWNPAKVRQTAMEDVHELNSSVAPSVERAAAILDELRTDSDYGYDTIPFFAAYSTAYNCVL